MPWWRKLRGIVVINHVSDDEDETPIEPKPKKPKKEEDPPKEKKEEIEEDPFYMTTPHEPTCLDMILYDKWVRIGWALLLCMFLGLLLPFILTSTAFREKEEVFDHRGYCFINDSIKFTCLEFDRNMTRADCEAVNCCFEISDGEGVPWCFHTVPSEYGYEVFNHTPVDKYMYSVQDEMTGETKERTLYRLEDSEKLMFDLKVLQKTTQYGGDIWPVEVAIERITNSIIKINMYSPGHEEGTQIKDPMNPEYNFDGESTDSTLDVDVTEEEDGAFNITVYRRNSGEVILETLYGPLMIGDGYMEFSMTMPTNSIYGLGTRFESSITPLFEVFDTWVLNSLDSEHSNISIADSHPVYIGVDPSEGMAHGIYLQTSSPLQISTVPAPGLSFRAHMGSFKIIVAEGPSPKEVSNQFTVNMGYPSFPPYWALGFHVCRTQLTKNQEKVFKDTYNAMVKDELPFESDCIDARTSYPDSYADQATWVTDAIDKLKQDNRKYLMANYPFVPTTSTAYDSSSDVFVKLQDDQSYYGLVSGEAVVYPDYLNENSFNNWLQANQAVLDRIKLADALILLQNSPLNEAKVDYAAVTDGNVTCSVDEPEYCCSTPPFEFMLHPEQDVVSNGTICWEAVHQSMQGGRHLAHHNAYGLYHTNRMYALLKYLDNSQRPVVMSSSTHPGTGMFGGQLSEGYGYSVSEQRRALQSVLNAGIALIPMAGVPACGSRNETGFEEYWHKLCLRSYQLSIFFPIFMSHYELGHTPRNPPDVRDGFTKQLQPFVLLRYMLVPTYYTLMEESSRTGSPILRPIAYEFPDDMDSLEVTDQFMIGSAMMVVPNFENYTEEVNVDVPAYFPPGNWYDFYSGRLRSDGSNGTYSYISTVTTDVNLLIRGGHVVFLLGNLHDPLNNTEDARSTNHFYSAMVAFSEEGAAQGYIYYDDGVTRVGSEGDYAASIVTAVASNVTNELVISSSAVPWLSEVVGTYCNSNHTSKVGVLKLYGLGTVTNVEVIGGSLEDFEQDDVFHTLTVELKTAFDWCSQTNMTLTWSY